LSAYTFGCVCQTNDVPHHTALKTRTCESTLVHSISMHTGGTGTRNIVEQPDHTQGTRGRESVSDKQLMTLTCTHRYIHTIGPQPRKFVVPAIWQQRGGRKDGRICSAPHTAGEPPHPDRRASRHAVASGPVNEAQAGQPKGWTRSLGSCERARLRTLGETAMAARPWVFGVGQPRSASSAFPPARLPQPSLQHGSREQV